ncbi:hypothetical protein [Nocardiopsis ansamitocini]|uniref:SPOR domain-containing protein n=1 Tax=Nocardiopsis ansamitocini TaxID=1670832 RepID=A0A9W6P333_9ACTN|nr:hypothetical protein [Nocardiopsis ansamitocini]GLU46133.1 hypothetical protein Nans01_04840 [Nocardiopsis ansamitocini]
MAEHGTSAGDGSQWWYSLKTNQVEYGSGSPGKDRLGPYPDKAAAQAALSTAAERNKNWDEADEEWNRD